MKSGRSVDLSRRSPAERLQLAETIDRLLEVAEPAGLLDRSIEAHLRELATAIRAADDGHSRT